jgi:hypothetical protein
MPLRATLASPLSSKCEEGKLFIKGIGVVV